MTNNQPLQPCPFCESDIVEHTGNEWEENCHVTCMACFAESGRWRTRAEAARAWNTRSRVSDGGVVATVDAPNEDDPEDLAWERQSAISAIAYEFMKLFGATVKDGWTHDEMRPLFDAAREIVTRTFPVLVELHAASPAAPKEEARAKCVNCGESIIRDGNEWDHEFEYRPECLNAMPTATPSPDAARHYFCSCGGALTAEEYIEHYFEKGHDRGGESNNERNTKHG